MPRRYLDTGGNYDYITRGKKKPFVYNDIDLQYEVDSDKLRVNPETGEVYQQGLPKGAVILPEVEVKGSQLKAVENANEQLERTPKEKGLENPVIDPFLIPITGGRYTENIMDDIIDGAIVRGISKIFPNRLLKSNIKRGLTAAANYKKSEGYRHLIESARQESKKMGIGDFSERLFSPNERRPTIRLSKRVKYSKAGYKPSTNTINIDPNQIKNEYESLGVPYHEALHWQRVGNPIISTSENEGFFNARDYLRRKASEVFYDNADEYIRDPRELIANGLEAGRVLNIEPFSPYPGIQEVSEAARAARAYNSYLKDIKLLSKKDYENFWKILTGNYIPAVLPTTIGSTIYNFNNNKSKQKSIKRNGGSIYIAPSKRGTFTAAATKHGMGVQEFAARVLRNKDDYSPSLVKKANFARNASKWNH